VIGANVNIYEVLHIGQGGSKIFFTFLIIEFTDIVDNAIAPFYYPPQFTGDVGLSEAKTH